MRNLDTSLLRAFVTVAEAASMTAAGHLLHLTQAAISQQIKRLEEGFGCALFERDRRGLKLTEDGERLFAKANRLLALNDEIWSDMTTPAFMGSIRLGLPYDLVVTYFPAILKGFARTYPKVEISLMCRSSPELLRALAAGEADLVVVEEPAGRSKGECLGIEPLVWVGGRGGEAFLKRPLPISFGCETCAFRPTIYDALRRSGLDWRTVSELGNFEAMVATVQTDLAVTAALPSTLPPGLDVLGPASGLPPLPRFSVNLHRPQSGVSEIAQVLSRHIRDGFVNRQRFAA
jgi:DNA-binding transcriptional LysR family regulator